LDLVLYELLLGITCLFICPDDDLELLGATPLNSLVELLFVLPEDVGFKLLELLELVVVPVVEEPLPVLAFSEVLPTAVYEFLDLTPDSYVVLPEFLLVTAEVFLSLVPTPEL
jgi:hypothetical protein